MPKTVAELVDLSGRVAVVTGGGAGMGRAICLRLAEAGARVVAADRDSSRAKETVAAIQIAGRDAQAAIVDVADVDAIANLAAATVTDFGRVDIWVNNAGIYPPAPLFSSTVEDWDRMLDVNLRSVYFGSREAARHMIGARSGVIVNIASIAAYRAGNPNLSHYAASKAGVVGLTKTFASAFGPFGVRVVGVAPGVVVTEGLRAGMEEMDRTGGNLGNRGEIVPLRRLGEGDDIARAVLFLVSGLAEYITGVTIAVDGGDLVRGTAADADLSDLGFSSGLS